MTMQKLFLPARPANEGARRLAWWLLDTPCGESVAVRRVLLARSGIGMIAVHRLLTGELLPGEEQGWAISRATRGAVRVGDWRDQPEGNWAERPVDHLAMRRAA